MRVQNGIGVLGLLIVATLTGCGSSDDAKKTAGNALTLDSIKGLPSGVQNKIALNGSVWIAECQKNGTGLYLQGRMEMLGVMQRSDTGDTFFDAGAMYADDQCQVLLLENKIQGSFAVTKDGKKATVNPRAYIMTSKSDALSDELNKQKACGLTRWKTDQPIDILDSDCSESAKNSAYFFSVLDGDELNLKKVAVYSCDGNQLSESKCVKVIYKVQ